MYVCSGLIQLQDQWTFEETTLAAFNLVFNVFAIYDCLYYISNLEGGVSAATSICGVLDQKNKINNGLKTETASKCINFEAVDFYFQSRSSSYILRGLDLDIEEGSRTALVGYSGSGKSTIFQLLVRLYDVAEGQILFGGRDIKEFGLKELRSLIGLVNQEPTLFSGSVYENICYGGPMERGQADELCKSLLLDVDLDTEVGARGTLLSGGQKQRVAIARLLAQNPEVILLDEATSALDKQTESAALATIEKCAEGKTLVMIAHRLSTIRHFSKICVVHEGRVFEAGNHEQLMERNGLYCSMAQTLG